MDPENEKFGICCGVYNYQVGIIQNTTPEGISTVIEVKNRQTMSRKGSF